MQPEGEAEYFEAVVNSLINKELVDGSADGHLKLHDLVGEYVELKKPIDLVTILCDEEGKLKEGRKLLAVFLSIHGKNHVDNHNRVLLWQAGAVFDENFTSNHWLHKLLDSDAENAILAIFQLYKATQQDAKALLCLMHGDECPFTAAEVLVSLTINGAENLLVDGDIENYVQLMYTHILQKFQANMLYKGFKWFKTMLQMANCSVFAKKMICHRPLLILMVEMIQKHKSGNYCWTFVEILVTLIIYVQGMKNTRSQENLLEEDKDVMREPMKSCVLDNTYMSHVVLFHGENSSRATEVPFFEPKFLFEFLQSQLQYMSECRVFNFWTWSYDIIRVLGRVLDITNGPTHLVEYGCVELLFCLQEPVGDIWQFQHVRRFLCHKVIFESISSNGHINSLVSILKHGTKENIIDVPWILQYLAVGHEKVVRQLITEVGVEKVAEAIELWGWQRPIWVYLSEFLERAIHQSSNMQP